METEVSFMKVLVPHPDLFQEYPELRGKFSFGPYLRFMKSKLEDPGEMQPHFVRNIVERFEALPEFSSTEECCQVIDRQPDLIQMVAATLFPVAFPVAQQFFSIATPYRFEVVYYSRFWYSFLNADENGYVVFPPDVPFEYVQYENLFLAYRFILKKFYKFHLSGQEKFIMQVTDPVKGLKRYGRVFIDENFVDAHLDGPLPPFPEEAICPNTHSILDFEKLLKLLPLSIFEFEGMVVRRVVDVTQEESIGEVKNALLEMQSAGTSKGYEKLTNAVEMLVELKNVEVSLTPFLKINNRYVLSEEYTSQSILLNAQPEKSNKESIYRKAASLLLEKQKTLYISNMHSRSEEVLHFPLFEYLEHSGICCYLMTPLFENGELIGMLEIASPESGVLSLDTLQKLEPLYTYFELAIKNNINRFRSRIDALVKEKFTALLPSVEWKFDEIAWSFLQKKEHNEEAVLGTVVFEEVYPIYGAIDIRNSSVERSKSIQNDLLEQLQLIEKTITNLQDNTKLPIMDYLLNILYKNEAMKQQVSNVLTAEDEIRVNEYLENEIKALFRHLSHTSSRAQDSIQNYFKSVDPQDGRLYHHRKSFDESLNQINDHISKYLETEEEKIQVLYPHYFEKYKTDGIEYNIYIGESIAQGKPFDYLYLKNLRLWQLSSMAEITRITHRLRPHLKIPLQTTQLILVHSNPIAISFRRAERRFDVEGAYNIRYEIMKKRIDKVHIRGIDERLTQPGKIAIVYTNKKEAQEYEEYIHFLQKKHLLLPDIEHHDLEEVQGLSGLKAIRVEVNLQD